MDIKCFSPIKISTLQIEQKNKIDNNFQFTNSYECNFKMFHQFKNDIHLGVNNPRNAIKCRYLVLTINPAAIKKFYLYPIYVYIHCTCHLLSLWGYILNFLFAAQKKKMTKTLCNWKCQELYSVSSTKRKYFLYTIYILYWHTYTIYSHYYYLAQRSRKKNKIPIALQS